MAEVVHIQQPEGSKLCGAACVAMALGLSLEEAVARIGHRRGVRNWEIIAALGKRAASRRAKPWRGVVYKGAELHDCLIRAKAPGRYWHVVLFAGGRVHDPAWPVPAPSIGEWLSWLTKTGWRPVTFFPLTTEVDLGR